MELDDEEIKFFVGVASKGCCHKKKKKKFTKKKVPLEVTARQLMTCCSCQCLNALVPGDLVKSKEAIMTYLDRWVHKTRQEHHRDWKELTSACITGSSPKGGHTTKDLSISLSPTWKVSVCSTAYHKIHNREHASFERLIAEIRRGDINGEQFRSNAALSPSLIKQLNKTGGAFGLRISNDEVNSANIGKGMKNIFAAVWMNEFFQMTGDPMPNTDGEIHLEKQEKKSIWEEYASDFKFKNRSPLSYSSFCELWTSSFPYVKIRVYKVCTVFIPSPNYSNM
jgi:hypothetical protein